MNININLYLTCRKGVGDGDYATVEVDIFVAALIIDWVLQVFGFQKESLYSPQATYRRSTQKAAITCTSNSEDRHKSAPSDTAKAWTIEAVPQPFLQSHWQKKQAVSNLAHKARRQEPAHVKDDQAQLHFHTHLRVAHPHPPRPTTMMTENSSSICLLPHLS